MEFCKGFLVEMTTCFYSGFFISMWVISPALRFLQRSYHGNINTPSAKPLMQSSSFFPPSPLTETLRLKEVEEYYLPRKSGEKWGSISASFSYPFFSFFSPRKSSVLDAASLTTSSSNPLISIFCCCLRNNFLNQLDFLSPVRAMYLSR